MSRSNRPIVNVPLPVNQDLSSQEEEQLITRASRQHMSDFQGRALVKLEAPDYSKSKVNIPAGLRERGSDMQELSRVVNEMKVAPLEQLPVIQSIGELVRDWPHLGDDQGTGQPNCAVAFTKFGTELLEAGHSISFNAPIASTPPPSVEPSNVNTDDITEMVRERMRRHLKAAHFDPWQLHVFRELIETIPVPTFFFRHQADQENLHQMLRAHQLRLPLMPASIETELLRESGEWKYRFRRTDGTVEERVYLFPPCSMAATNKCVCQAPLVGLIDGLDRPMVPVSLLYADEWKRFLRTGSPADSGQSWQPRPCIMCCRAQVSDFVMFIRSTSMYGFSSHQQTGFKWETDQVLQLYRNIKDGKDGYAKQFMLEPMPTFKEPIVESIAANNAALLVCRTDDNGRRYIDQSAIVWRPLEEPSPRLGESIALF